MLYPENKCSFTTGTLQAVFSAPLEKCYEKHRRCTREKKEKRKKYRDIPQLLMLRRRYFLTGKPRESAADMRNKIATRIKRRKREWLHDCEGTLKKFGHMKNADTREENTGWSSRRLL